MPATFRLATFNCENVFARYRFRSNFDPVGEDGFTINDLAFDIYDEVAKRITAQAIKAVDADILCLQEIESLPVLDRFQSRYLARCRYRHRLVIDGNDPRAIDCAILSRFPIVRATTYRHERNAANTAFLFSRDCLEAVVLVPREDGTAARLTLYVNHFKSMIGGREATRPRRQEQAERVAAIIDGHWRCEDYEGNFAVLGDFNDHVDEATALGALVDHASIVDVVRASDLPEDQRWTHFFAGGNEYRQLDYLMLGRPLFERAGAPAPGIMRQGLPFRAERYAGERFDDVGESHPKASDHAPLFADIPIAALV